MAVGDNQHQHDTGGHRPAPAPSPRLQGLTTLDPATSPALRGQLSPLNATRSLGTIDLEAQTFKKTLVPSCSNAQQAYGLTGDTQTSTSQLTPAVSQPGAPQTLPPLQGRHLFSSIIFSMSSDVTFLKASEGLWRASYSAGERTAYRSGTQPTKTETCSQLNQLLATSCERWENGGLEKGRSQYAGQSSGTPFSRFPAQTSLSAWPFLPSLFTKPPQAFHLTRPTSMEILGSSPSIYKSSLPNFGHWLTSKSCFDYSWRVTPHPHTGLSCGHLASCWGMGLNARGWEAHAGAGPSASEEAWLTSQQQRWGNYKGLGVVSVSITGPLTPSERALMCHSCAHIPTCEIRQGFYHKKDTVFKFIHVFRLGGISVAVRKVEGVILRVIMDGITDQSFSRREESVLVSPCLASGSPILFATCALKIIIGPEAPNLDASTEEAWPPYQAHGSWAPTSTPDTNLTTHQRRQTQRGPPQVTCSTDGKDGCANKYLEYRMREAKSEGYPKLACNGLTSRKLLQYSEWKKNQIIKLHHHTGISMEELSTHIDKDREENSNRRSRRMMGKRANYFPF